MCLALIQYIFYIFPLYISSLIKIFSTFSLHPYFNSPIFRLLMKQVKEILYGIKESFNPDKKASAIMDTLVIQQSDGSLKSTPFYVHFGVGKLVDSDGKFVDIYHRGQATGLSMRLDRSGVASFFRGGIDAHCVSSEVARVDEEVKVSDKNYDENTLEPEVNQRLNNSADLPDIQDIPKSGSNESFNSSPEEFKESPNQLSNPELVKLQLELGLNIIDYVVRDRPTVYLRGKVYLWPQSSKIVISDIDGTLTKSDLMGHVHQMFGSDYTRGGVVYFFQRLEEKGYKILYLTARSLGQIDTTRDYLMQIRQEGSTLPDGPLFLNPVGIFTALVSEMKKKSKDFKERVLTEIKEIFGNNPFHSGIGNRLGDSIAYASVGIHRDMIFIIDKKGKEKGDHVTIKNFKDSKLKIEISFPQINN